VPGGRGRFILEHDLLEPWSPCPSRSSTIRDSAPAPGGDRGRYPRHRGRHGTGPAPAQPLSW